MRIAIVKSSSVKVLILVSLLVPVLLSGCSSGSASVSTPTIGNVNCQATPSKCLPIVTATTVPATYVCSGKHNFRSNEGILKVVAYGRGDNARNEETELSDLSGDMAEQVGGRSSQIESASTLHPTLANRIVLPLRSGFEPNRRLFPGSPWSRERQNKNALRVVGNGRR